MTGWARVWLLVLALIAASVAFVAFPAVDLAVSGLFFDGTAFPVEANRGIEAIRLALYAAEDLAAAVTLGLTILTARRGLAILRLGARDWFYAFGVFAVGPGLLVNGILKPVFGRARPFQVEAFGGPAPFTQAWAICDRCQGNKSFVSGEVAGAVALAIMFGMILVANRAALGRAGWRLGWIAIAALPLFTAWQRIAAGRHFLSDVVLAALMTALVATILARQFYPAKARASAVDFPRDSP